jgi:hypothetical protein
MTDPPESDGAALSRPDGFSRRTLFAAGGVSAILGAAVGAVATDVARPDTHSGPLLWQRAERNGAPRNPYGFVAFDVDPGSPGELTSMHATYYAIDGPFGSQTGVLHRLA